MTFEGHPRVPLISAVTGLLVDDSAIASGQDRLAGIIRELLKHRLGTAGLTKLDRAALLDPRYFVSLTKSSPSPTDGLSDVRMGTAIAPPLDKTAVALVAAQRFGYWPQLAAWDDAISWKDTGDSSEGLRLGLERAFTILTDVQPRLSKALQSVVRVVVTYSGTSPNSFAALQAHGAIFLNWQPGDDLAFSIEELAHQGGHVLLTAMLFGAEHEYFVVAPDSALVSGDAPERDSRSALVVLHAVFTEALMTASLWGALHSPELTSLERHELRGRLEYVLIRFRYDLVDLLSAEVLSERGRDLVARCRYVFELAIEGWARTAPRLDLSGQPYAFSRNSFLRNNPCPSSTLDGGDAPIV